MTRVLSKPSTPHANNGRDNENDDLILRVNDELGARVSSGPMGRHGRENFEAHDDDEDAATYRIMDSLGSGTFGASRGVRELGGWENARVEGD